MGLMENFVTGILDIIKDKPINPWNPFQGLAYRASMGDVGAMLELSWYFRTKLSQEYLVLEQKWEESPRENVEELVSYLNAHEEERFHVNTANMWLNRAQMYGNAEAEKCLEKHPFWKTNTAISRLFFYPEKGMCISMPGKVLRKMGFLEFKENQNYSLDSMDYNGIYSAETDAGYDGPDEDGFGMEEYYNFYRFDEFFHEIGRLDKSSRAGLNGRKESFERSFNEKKEEFARRREKYWARKRNGIREGRYHYLLSKRQGAIVINGELEHYAGTQEKSVEIPEGVVRIGPKAFESCSFLKCIKIPERIKRIDTMAFARCKNLEKVVLPKVLEYLGSYVFTDSRELTSIEFPEELETLADGMFMFCTALKEVRLPSKLERIGEQCFEYSGIQKIVLPETLKEIGKGAFENCKELKSVVIPESVKKIGEDAFYGCTSLENVVLSETLKEIGKGAFKYCEGLKSVVIPESVKKIGWYVFTGCSSLEKVVMPAGVKDIGYDAFDKCKKLTIYGYSGTEAEEYAARNEIPFVSMRDFD